MTKQAKMKYYKLTDANPYPGCEQTIYYKGTLQKDIGQKYGFIVNDVYTNPPKTHVRPAR